MNFGMLKFHISSHSKVCSLDILDGVEVIY